MLEQREIKVRPEFFNELMELLQPEERFVDQDHNLLLWTVNRRLLFIREKDPVKKEEKSDGENIDKAPEGLPQEAYQPEADG